MTVPPLESQVEQFSEEMTDLLTTVIGPEVSISGCELEREKKPSLFIVGNHVPSVPHTTHIGHLSGEHIRVPGADRLSLYIWWTFVPSSSGEWIKVEKSQFGLYVESSKGKPSPFIRLEVAPMQRPSATAHINVTGSSTLLGQIYGILGRPHRRLENLHLPVGGFYYRPCLEDFLEFLIDEGLLPERDGWESAVNKYRDGYHRKQLSTLVEKNPDVAIDTLTRKGLL